MNITIVGLGLIGGSIARRLRGFHDCTIHAIDINKQSLELAKFDGVIDNGFTDGKEALNQADLIILCLYPSANIDFINTNLSHIKPNAIITDVCGVKKYIIEEMEKILPESVDFIGGHPMAGRELGGYSNSTDTLFNNASYLITPTEKNKPQNIALIRSLAEYIGSKQVISTSPDEHDAIIAYTSQLMHAVAVSLCDNPMIERSTFFSAGSLRDCTRVARINEKLWSELFLANSGHLTERIEEMQSSLESIKQTLINNDKKALEDIMIRATKQKIEWLTE